MYWLDPIGIVIGILTAIPIVWTWWEIAFGRKRRYRRWFHEAREGKSPDGVLIVDLLSNQNMKPEVLRYLNQQGMDVPDENIFEINEHGEVTPENLPDKIEKLRQALSEISHLAPGQLHIFYGGPSAFAMIVGAELANKGNVHVYQRTHGEYSDWGPIRHAYF